MLGVLLVSLVSGTTVSTTDLVDEFRLLRQRVPNERSFAAFKALDARGYRAEATQVLGGLLLSYDSKDEENELMSVAAMLTWRGNELDAEFLCRRVRKGVGGHHIQIFQNIASLRDHGSMRVLKDVLDWKVKHDDDPVDAYLETIGDVCGPVAKGLLESFSEHPDVRLQAAARKGLSNMKSPKATWRAWPPTYVQ